MNEKNLISLKDRTIEEQREIARKGGIASGEARREKKLFREAIEKKLGKSIDSIVDSMIEAASKDKSVQAAQFLRDTIGEKPTDKVEADVNVKEKLEDLL